jgi:hypothetical protein
VDYYLEATQTSYVDLLLIHWPTSGKNSSDPVCQPQGKAYDAKACQTRVALSFRTVICRLSSMEIPYDVHRASLYMARSGMRRDGSTAFV